MSFIKCSGCNILISANAEKCPNCGNPIVSQTNKAIISEKESYFGIAALVLGIIGFIIAGVILGTLAIVFGAKGINRSNEKHPSLAKAGLILGIVDIIAAIFFLLSSDSWSLL